MYEAMEKPRRDEIVVSSAVPVVILQCPSFGATGVKKKTPLALTITRPAAGTEILMDLTTLGRWVKAIY